MIGKHTLGDAFFLNIGTIGELKAVFEERSHYCKNTSMKITKRSRSLNDTQQIYIVQVNDESDLFERF